MPKNEKKQAIAKEPVLSEEEKERIRLEKYNGYVAVFNNLSCMTPTDAKLDMLKHLQKEFESYGEYEDAVELAKTCKNLRKEVAVDVKKFNYEDCMRRIKEATSEEEFVKIRQTYVEMGDYEDAISYIKQCDEQLRKIRRRERYATVRKSVILILILALIFSTKTKFVQYNAAKGLRKITSYKKSAELFKHLDSYKDSQKRYDEASYQYAKHLNKKGDLEKARDIFYEINTFRDSAKRLVTIENELLKQSEIGQVVSVGANTYIVLEKQEDKVFLMKNKGLKPILYSNNLEEVTWEKSSVREYLNQGYIKDAFCKLEREHIITTEVINTANSMYNTKAGNSTQDLVYLLSAQEANTYSAIINEKSRKIAWLRTPGAIQSAASVYGSKQVNEYGYAVNSNAVSAYPVLWYSFQ